MLDIWREIWSTLRKNKLRTFLTGFSVAWGIFMLILLLGAGNGLKNGVSLNFGDRAKNSVYIWPGRTSQPFAGLPKDRQIKFRPRETRELRDNYPAISNFTPSISVWGATISYGKEYGNNTVKGVNPEYVNIQNIVVEAGSGRFINDADMAEQRKVMVIHRRTADILFRDENPLGKYVVANHVAYQVIGIYNDDDMNTSPEVYIPLTTAQTIYNPDDGYSAMELTMEGIKSADEGEQFTQGLRATLGKIYTFDANDRRAIYVWNMLENYLQTMGIFNGISLFVWIIGIGTLIAGIVGVSNIMLITVKERTHEFGIRKALGASPASILKLVVIESILITVFFGYLGMIAGIGLTEGVSALLGQPQGRGVIFTNPTIELSIAVSATVLLVIAGVLAGYFPARKAVSIKPVEALRYE